MVLSRKKKEATSESSPVASAATSLAAGTMPDASADDHSRAGSTAHCGGGDDVASPRSASISLGAGSFAHSPSSTAPTPDISNKLSSRRLSNRRNRIGDDDQSVCSVGSVGSVSASSLGVGTILPLQPASSQEDTPTSSNKSIYPLLSAAAALTPPSSMYYNRDPSPLLGASVASSDENHLNDTISVLSGQSAAARSASPAAGGPLFLPSTIRASFPNHHNGLEPIRQQHHYGSAGSLVGRSVEHGRDDASHDASTLVSGISFVESEGGSPIRRSARRYDKYGDGHSINTGTTSKKSRRRKKKRRNPFRRRKKEGGGKEGDSVSAFSSVISDMASIASARSRRSQRSTSTMGSTSSRLSAFANKLRRKGEKKKKGQPESPSRSQSKVGHIETTPDRMPADTKTLSSLASTSFTSGPSTPVRRGSPKNKSKDSPAHSNGSQLNTTLPTVESYDDEDDVSTLSSVISGLSAGASATPQRVGRWNRGYQQQGNSKKKEIGSSAEFPPIYFETSRAVPLLTLEEGFDDEEDEFRRKSNEGGKNNKLLDDPSIPAGLSGRISTEDLMARLSIRKERGNNALGQLRRLHAGSEEHDKCRMSTRGSGFSIPYIAIGDISIPDYETYVEGAVDSFRRKLGISDELYKSITCAV